MQKFFPIKHVGHGTPMNVSSEIDEVPKSSGLHRFPKESKETMVFLQAFVYNEHPHEGKPKEMVYCIANTFRKACQSLAYKIQDITGEAPDWTEE